MGKNKQRKKKLAGSNLPTGSHRIEINYDTGDSFSTQEGCVGWLDYGWEKIETAQENVARIREHYKMVQQLADLRYPKTQTEIYDRYKRERWYSEQYPNFCLMLLDNEGNNFRYSASMWCGYFENLNSARIITE